MHTRTINFDGDVDLAALPAHLADCLRRLDARAVKVDQNRVSFTGGLFRLVGNWNVLIPFGFGDLMIDPIARNIRYRLSFRQLIIFATVGVGILIGSFAYESHSWGTVTFMPIAWIWLVGGNLAIGLPRFKKFLDSAIETAPRTNR
jgi:hypothetical protein